MSKTPRRVPERIQDMLEAIGNLRSDLGGLGKEEFLADGKTQRAIIESLIVIGEAANKIMQLDPTIQQNMPSLWQHCRDAYDMRIVLTHEYFRVDPGVLWTTIKDSVPPFETQLISFLEQPKAP
jgi:uncharacterized protein with HEPN domain